MVFVVHKWCLDIKNDTHSDMGTKGKMRKSLVLQTFHGEFMRFYAEI